MKKFITLALIIAVAILGYFLLSIKADVYGKTNGTAVEVIIPGGATTAQITDLLSQNRVIKYKWAFRIFVRSSPLATQFKEGVHQFTTQMGYESITTELARLVPLSNMVKVTIPEGYDIQSIGELLEENGLTTLDEFMTVAQNTQFPHWFLADIPDRDKKLEGYLFPATYDFHRDIAVTDIVTALLDRFGIMLTDEYISRVQQLDMSLDEITTLASIIEKEAAGDYDRPLVSSVFHNRLKSNTMPYLQSCATVVYALPVKKTVLSNEDTTYDSPYNTYIYKGLPVGPISSPGEKSFQAALYPEDTDYLFFAVGSEGKHVFTRTLEEHLRVGAQ